MVSRLAVGYDIAGNQRVGEDAGRVDTGRRKVAVNPTVLNDQGILDGADLNPLRGADGNRRDLAAPERAAIGAVRTPVHIDIGDGLVVALTQLTAFDGAIVGIDIEEDRACSIGLEDQVGQPDPRRAHGDCRCHGREGKRWAISTIAQTDNTDADHIQVHTSGASDRLGMSGHHINRVTLIVGT